VYDELAPYDFTLLMMVALCMKCKAKTVKFPESEH